MAEEIKKVFTEQNAMFIQLFKNVYFLILCNDHWRAIEVSVKSGHEGHEGPPIP